MTGSDPLLRAARFVGDFGNPFYDEERQRDVWNEASAFGLQLVLWLGLLLATGAVWLVGAASVPYVLAGIALLGIVSAATVGYALRLGIQVGGSRVLRWRMLPYLLLLAALAVGLIRAGEVSASVGTGLLAGAAAAVAVLAVARHRAGRAPAS